MMAAVQPFLSRGDLARRATCPSEATVDDIREAYLEGWKLGLKALAIYRDGSKGSQPVSTKSETDAKADGRGRQARRRRGRRRRRAGRRPPRPPSPARRRSPRSPAAGRQPRRERLPHTRRSLTHKFDIQGHEGYVNVGFYPDGRPGEVFITMAKEGSTIGGLMDVLGTSISIGLQYGVPLEVFVNKFAHSRFEPAGFTKNPDIPIAKSIDRLHLPLARAWSSSPATARPTPPSAPTDEPEPTPSRPVVKVNGHRTATIADLEHAEAVLGTKPAPAPRPRRHRPDDRGPREAATSSSPTSRATPPPATTAGP